jgi:LacI family transcriptional regulator
MAVTIRHVAEKSGLSLMTVSSILNNKAQLFRPETRNRVLRAAEELGYRPNAMARATRSGRFGCVALLQSSLPHRSVLPAGLLGGIQHAVAEHNLQLILADLPDSKLTDEAYVPSILRQLTVDGLLVNYNAGIPQRLVELVQQFKLPAVWVNSKHSIDCIHPNDVQAGEMVTRRLLELGHRRIAYVDYAFGHEDSVVHYSTTDRYDGYASVMREAGLAPQLYRPRHKLPDHERLQASHRLLSGADRPTALIAYNVNTAGPLLYAAACAGLRVPEMLSVATFFDERSSGMGIEYGGARLAEYDMGQQAVTMLLKKIGDPSAVPGRALPLLWEAGDTIARVQAM